MNERKLATAMKPILEQSIDPDLSPVTAPSVTPESEYSERAKQLLDRFTISNRALIAVYDSLGAAPRVERVEPSSITEYIGALSARIYELAREQGSPIPYTVIREVAENFIHADFAEPVVSILDAGRTIRFADQGPGIDDKNKAVLPGFSTARGEVKRYIRGVGSGLPIVQDYLSFTGGSLSIEDNLGSGAVVTIRARDSRPADGFPQGGYSSNDGYPDGGYSSEHLSARSHTASYHTGAGSSPISFFDQRKDDSLSRDPLPRESLTSRSPMLSGRQKQVLALVLESGSVGPSLVAKELGVGISTAYRDLAFLEEVGLITSESGKRTLSLRGLSYIDELTRH